MPYSPPEESSFISCYRAFIATVSATIVSELPFVAQSSSFLDFFESCVIYLITMEASNENEIDNNEECTNLNGENCEKKMDSNEDTAKQSAESRPEMLARHQHEIKELRNKELGLKKGAAKGSKAEQKAKKKQVEDEIAKLDAKMKARHSKELASLGYKSEEGGDSKGMDTLVKAIAGVSVTSDSRHSGKPSKGLQRRAKRAQQEAEREQRIQEEQSNLVSDRAIEEKKLEQKLKPLGLTLHEIKPDGHCLYRAVENQLSLQPENSCKYTYQQLREMAAAYMRCHADHFLPFFSAEAGSDTGAEEDINERFEKYCREVESTAWGGQLELDALANSLKKHMIIFSGSYPEVEMGEDYKSLTEGAPNSSIMLSYHKHAYGLGEHYNSVVPDPDFAI